MADTYIRFYGLYHISGDKVSVAIGGLDCGDFVVDSLGSVSVPLGGDAGGLLTASYITGLDGFVGEQACLISFDDGTGTATYTIPVVIGMAYTSQWQVLRPATQDDIKSPQGPALGKLRRPQQFAALLQNCINGAISFGVDFANSLFPVDLRAADKVTPLNGLALFSGVYRATVSAPDDFDGELCGQVNRPVPATIVQLAGYYETSDV